MKKFQDCLFMEEWKKTVGEMPLFEIVKMTVGRIKKIFSLCNINENESVRAKQTKMRFQKTDFLCSLPAEKRRLPKKLCKAPFFLIK